MNNTSGMAAQGMSMDTRLSAQLGRYLDLAVSQAKLTAANMANIDTPGYQTQGFDFDTAMRRALSDLDAGRPEAQIPVSGVDGLVSRPDGNNVSMDRESLQLAEAQLKFKTGVALLRLEYQKINDAIHADSK